MSNTIHIKDAIKAAGPRTGSVAICLKADLVGEYEERERRLAEALRKKTTSLAGNGSGAIIADMDQLRDQPCFAEAQRRLLGK